MHELLERGAAEKVLAEDGGADAVAAAGALHEDGALRLGLAEQGADAD